MTQALTQTTAGAAAAAARSSGESAPSVASEPKPATSTKRSEKSGHDVAQVPDAIQAKVLEDWYKRLGVRRAKDTFGELTLRAARLQLGVPYAVAEKSVKEEKLRIVIETFQCVSFVESTLAVARCTWSEQQTAACFAREVQAFRYREGEIDGYPSRLHYFSEWLDNNHRRQRIRSITGDLGGEAENFTFNFMSQHKKLYPALGTPEVAQAIDDIESRLSRTPRMLLERDHIAPSHSKLQPGDLVAVVGTKSGIFIKHAGFIDPSPTGTPRLLHASSHHERVLLTKRGLAAYIKGWPDRRGVTIARPLPPQ